MHHPIIVRKTSTGHAIRLLGTEVHRMYGSDAAKARWFAMDLLLAMRNTKAAVIAAAA